MRKYLFLVSGHERCFNAPNNLTLVTSLLSSSRGRPLRDALDKVFRANLGRDKLDNTYIKPPRWNRTKHGPNYCQCSTEEELSPEPSHPENDQSREDSDEEVPEPEPPSGARRSSRLAKIKRKKWKNVDSKYTLGRKKRK